MTMRRLITDPNRQFFPGLPLQRYAHQWPNRVWKLFHQTPARYTTQTSTAHDAQGRGCDYLDHHAYAVGVRVAIFIIYSEWPDAGQTKLNLLQDFIQIEFHHWQNNYTLKEITYTLFQLDI